MSGIIREEQIGPCRLLLGDCLEILPTLEAGSVDAVVTDPPYGINRENHGGMLESRPRIVNDADQVVGNWVIEWAWNMPIAVFSSPKKPFVGEWRNVICWDKGEAVAGGGDPSRCLKLSWELIQIARNGIMDGGREGSVWRQVVTQRDFENHPNEKPLSLILRLLGKFFGDAGTILDPFMGSGTTGVACIKTGRQFIGIEIEPKYFDISVKRCKDAWKLERSKLKFEPEPKYEQRELALT